MVLVSTPEPTVPVRPPTRPDPLPPIEVWNYNDHFPGLGGITWTGWNGRTWNLWCGGENTVTSGVALGRRVRGLHYGQIEDFVTDSPAVDGARFLGWQMKPREVFLNLRVYRHTSSQEWLEHDREFWQSMLPVVPGVRGPGRLTVTHPNGDRRWLTLYPQHKGDYEYDSDPTKNGWASYGQYFMAYDPYWVTDPISPRVFSQSGATGFFGGQTGGKGPSYTIATSSAIGSATISNPGEEYAWPVWTFRGPFTSVRIGLASSKVLSELVMNVADGDWIVVDTDPMAQSVVDSTGARRLPTKVSGAPFFAIPPGSNLPITAEMAGTGTIEVSLQPRYHRAW